MEFNFINLDVGTVVILFLIGFIGGMVSGFIGSGGAFVLTPAMMSLGVPAVVAVASNMAHKFPKALVGAIKRAKFGQVDLKLGLIMGLFAEIGVFIGKEIMIGIRDQYGNLGTDLYVSVVFIIILALFGSMVLKDAFKEKKSHLESDSNNDDIETKKETKLVRWVHSLKIPGTMVYLPSTGKRVSFLVIIPLGFATGLLAASIAVGGFIGVPAMMYVLGVPAIIATATELVVAFVMGLGGTVFYAWEGAVDIRLSMVILFGSLFGLQIGAIGTTYVKEYTVKLIMATIMLVVLFSRLVKTPVYLSQLDIISPLNPIVIKVLDIASYAILMLALLVGAVSIIIALIKGMIESRQPISAASETSKD